jgi:hypothetical protein
MILWQWYWETNPLNGTSEQFAIVVATTCAHYSSNKLNFKNHWSTPPILVSEIIKAIGAATERFSSPLNAHPSIHKHYSYREADAIFGFKYDAYSARFSGPWYMNPEYDAEEIVKSVRWAASSAASDTEPNLGIAIIPKYDESAHTAMLGSHPQEYTYSPRYRKASTSSHKIDGGGRPIHWNQISRRHCCHLQLCWTKRIRIGPCCKQ